MNIKGVITGDIVKSKEINNKSRDELLQVVNNIANDLQGISVIKTEVYRGDSFQIVVDSAALAVKVAILLRAKLRQNGWDARLAVGVGSIDYNSNEIVTSDGEAFNNSGREFDAIKKRKLVVRTPWEDINSELKVSTAFADNIVSRWTKQQAEAIFLYLSQGDINKKDIAENISKSAQAISKLLITANESLISDYLDRCEYIIKTKSN